MGIKEAAKKAAQALRATVEVSEPRWCPSELTGKQKIAATLPHQEVLWGGAAGGGKSFGLLGMATEYVDRPGYAAIIFRRTYADLAKPGALMDMAHEWFSSTAAKWDSQKKQWKFPSGAIIAFGYLENDADRFNYAGGAYQFIGYDEVTHLSEVCYTFLLSRLRRLITSNIPIRARSTANPGGQYWQWVRDRFIPEDFTSAAMSSQDVYEKSGIDAGGNNVVRAFVPALATDNPYLDFVEYEKMLNQLDPVTREQLLRGDWVIQQKGDVFPQWDERRHIISWTDFANVVGQKKIPDNWVCGVAMDWGSTASHPYAVVFSAVPPENHPLAGTVFVYRLLTGCEQTARQVAERILAAQRPWNEHDRTISWVGSHEQKAVRDTFITEHGLPFGARKGNAESGIDIIRDYLQIRGDKPDPFRQNEKGMPSVYFVVDDGEVLTPKTDAGLCRLRSEFPLYHYTESGRVFNKAMNDALDALRYNAGAFWPALAPVSRRERLLERLNSVRVDAPLGELDSYQVALIGMQRKMEQDAILAKERFRDSNSHPLDYWMNGHLGGQ